MNPRILAQATLCKLLVGSFRGQTRCCPCDGKVRQCAFSRTERIELSKDAKVIAARDRNAAEYEQMKDIDDDKLPEEHQYGKIGYRS